MSHACETTPLEPVLLSSNSPLASAQLPLDRRQTKQVLVTLLAKAHALREQGQLAGVPSSLELVLVSDGQMSELNKQAMHCVGPTNILSFPGEPLESMASLVLASETLLRESQLYGQDERVHLVRLLAHGLCHVCGLDHGAWMDQCEAALQEAGLAQLRAAGVLDA